LIVAAAALVMLLAAQFLLSNAIRGTNYYGVDGKMAQSTALAMLKFGIPFDVTGISAVQGIGSQMLPKNAWANPAFWPFAFLEKEAATDVSALIALACFAIGCYVMARCFDVPVLLSAIAAQLCIALFAPALLIVHAPTNFCLTPADAVVHVPYMLAIGLLARLQAGSRCAVALTTLAIFTLVLYSIYCDPLWAMVAGIAWAIPFAVVVFGTVERRTILVRATALACCLALLVASGVAEYLYTLSQYTARVQFAAALDRARDAGYVSALTYSPNLKYFYFACMVGWLLGLVAFKGRARLLVMASVAAFVGLIFYSVIYLLLQNGVWVGPIPIYLEQCWLVLFMVAALAGAWGALSSAAALASRPLHQWRIRNWLHFVPTVLGSTAVALIFVAITPSAVARYALQDAKSKADTFYIPWPNAPELTELLQSNISLAPGQPFRGSVNFLRVDHDTGAMLTHLWSRGIPTPNEYGQQVSGQSIYFVHKLLKRDIRGHLNRFNIYWSNGDYHQGNYSEHYWKALQVLGVRYSAERSPLPAEFNPGLSGPTTKPYRPSILGGEPGSWYVYELPKPNVGNYSPTRVTIARTGEEIMARVAAPDFDFLHEVVLSGVPGTPLVPARDMRLSVIRGGLHVSGKSDGTSLVVLPQQFSNCLQPSDPKVRLVRANLMLTGMIFSGEVDTDILFQYGMFSPGCRRADLVDVKRLDLKIDLRMNHLSEGPLFPDWDGGIRALRRAVEKIQ
jgi:hypothetical protein